MNELSQREIVKLNRWYEEIKAQRASGLTVMEKRRKAPYRYLVIQERADAA